MEIILNDVSYSYSLGTPFAHQALKNITTTIESKSYVAIIGQTGSGKSTLLQHLNALILPSTGQISIGERLIRSGEKNKDLRLIRKEVGIVFQFPEHQLFEETVIKDVMFGPMNFGVSEENAKLMALKALEMVKLPLDIQDKSPFELSGGQMRRVAIAGVLAMEPKVIILDEPTAGLDPRGRKEIMDMFYQLHKEKGLTTILVTHSMEDASTYADKIVILQNGEIIKEGTPLEIFSDDLELERLSLDVPEIVKFQKKLEKQFKLAFTTIHLTPESLVMELMKIQKGGK